MRAISLSSLILLAGALLAGGPVHAQGHRYSERAMEVVHQAQSGAKDIPERADALIRLAWPEGERDHEAAAMARETLTNFGDYGFTALFLAMDRVPRRYTADLTAAMIETRRIHRSGLPASYLPGLERAVWFGSMGAKRLALRELSRHGHLPAMLPTIDTAYDNPQLAELVLTLVPGFGHAGARFYLEKMLREGTEDQRALAAVGLARIGGRALETLREATFSERPEIRQVAVEALIPVTGVNDLTTLHEYVATHPDDDPAVIDRVRERAIQLEGLLREALDQESATPRDY